MCSGDRLRLDLARDEHRLRVAVAEGLQQIITREELERELVEGNLRIIHQLRPALFLGGVFRSQIGEVFPEAVDLVLIDGKSRGHRVSAARQQVRLAGTDRLDE